MKRRATYQDVLDAPEHHVAELVDGELHVQARPRSPHTVTASRLIGLLHPRDPGDPAWGWCILIEPELWLGQPDPRALVLVPDLAGWRSDRYVDAPDSGFTTPPDWVAEVLSPSTARFDRLVKLDRYARAGVAHAWLVDPAQRSVEVFALRDGVYARVAHAVDDEAVALPPFAGPIAVGRWWPAPPGAAGPLPLDAPPG